MRGLRPRARGAAAPLRRRSTPRATRPRRPRRAPSGSSSCCACSRDELARASAPRTSALTAYGTVLATLPGHRSRRPTIAFLAHVDTAPQFNATGVKPIVAPRLRRRRASASPTPPTSCSRPRPSPYLAERKVGDDIVTASGTTLLGADDKAGVAIIMTVARHLLAHPGIAHGPIRIAFTPDEEIGRGVHADLPADLARRGRLHPRRRRARRDRLRELLRRQGGGARRGRLDPPRRGQGQARQRAAPRREDRRHPAAGHPDARRPPPAARASCTSTR